MQSSLRWKENWSETKKNFIRWWRGEGMILNVTTLRDEPIDAIDSPLMPTDIEERWTNPAYRCSKDEYKMAQRSYIADSIPYLDTHLGPGSLALYLGARASFDERTVWYNPCLDDSDNNPLHFEPENNKWWKINMAIIEEGLKRAQGRYLVCMPDLVEHVDTLASLRETQELLYDFIDRPEWVHARLAEISEAWFTAFDLIYAKIRDEDGGNTFSYFDIWGPGKTAKLQCDLSAMISPEMYREFVMPYLEEQCKWLDFPLYHLDGTTALQHLDCLLEIESLATIQWTPQSGLAGPGMPEWFDLYKKIKAGGKSVELLMVEVDEVVPLLDAVGPEGMCIRIADPVPEAEAEKLLKAVEPFR
ncbi:MAG: hypothetical protein HQM14_18060 [SAR324 cluster bacterium]|nr:hypothetical protein [SAR324 cluster bacterium]